MIEKKILHYNLLEKLGEGGMGVVYKAYDTRLERIVAIKFLPKHLGTNAEERKRFEIEAKASAALCHPNIAMTYAAEEVDGDAFIVMEYIKGQELQNIIASSLPNMLSLQMVLGYAIRIAEGLQAAHEKGIIHRDIKSANIMITEKDQVKIMDFGLAKVRGSAGPTKPHSTLGTAAYMSPEQARGEEIDFRTDIWSFGIVLYEMLTGQLPFRGEFDSAILYSVMNEKPEPILNLRKDVSPELEQIVCKCLEKDKSKRYSSAVQLLNNFDKLKYGHLNKPVELPKRKEEQKPISRFIIPIILIAMAIFFVMMSYNVIKKKRPEPKINHIHALTKTPKVFERKPNISPDGSRVAYVIGKNGNDDIWVHQIASGQRINLTENYKGFDSCPSWSPDGKWIAFISSRDGGGMYIIPESGGIARKVIACEYSDDEQVCWFPNGENLLFLTNHKLYIVKASGGEADSIALPHECYSIGTAWSPDAQRIVYSTLEYFTWEQRKSQIWSAKLDGSNLIKVFETTGHIQSPTWTHDGKYIFFKWTQEAELMRQLLWMPVGNQGRAADSPEQLAVGVNCWDFSFSYNGKKLAYLGGVGFGKNFWTIPLNVDRVLTMDDAVKIPIEKQNIWNWAMSPDHEWIAFCSDRSGQPDIWLIRTNGKELRQLTADSLFEGALVWSPDGGRIAFEYRYSENDDIYILGSSSKKLKRPG
ncbi:serine/threonine-protein kinase [candidate division KSB1 bacterium]|nr:serine/threonine-protein kinase [candidate division KSB1 bacterium]